MKYKYILLSMIQAALFFSCYDLDRKPADALDENSFWKTQTHADQAMMGFSTDSTVSPILAPVMMILRISVFPEVLITVRKIIAPENSPTSTKVLHGLMPCCRM